MKKIIFLLLLIIFCTLSVQADDEEYTYICGDKSKSQIEIKVKYFSKINDYNVNWSYAVVRYGNHALELPNDMAASGSRYSNDKITFWSKGNEGALYGGEELAAFLSGSKIDVSEDIECYNPINLEKEFQREKESDDDSGCAKHPLIKKYAATGKVYSLLNEPGVKSELKRLVGDQLQHLLRNIQHNTSLDLEVCNLVISGSRPWAPTSESGIIYIDPGGGSLSRPITITAAIQSDDTITVFSEADESIDLPYPVQKWIDSIKVSSYERAR